MTRRVFAVCFAAIAAVASARVASPLHSAADYRYTSPVTSNLIHGTLRVLDSQAEADLILRAEDVAFLYEAEAERSQMWGHHVSPGGTTLANAFLNPASFSVAGGDSASPAAKGFVDADLSAEVVAPTQLGDLGNQGTFMNNVATAAFCSNVADVCGITWSIAPAATASLSGPLMSSAIDSAYRAIASPKTLYTPYPYTEWGAEVVQDIKRTDRDHYDTAESTVHVAYSNKTTMSVAYVSSAWLNNARLYLCSIQVWAYTEQKWNIAWGVTNAETFYTDERYVVTNATLVGQGQYKTHTCTITTANPTNYPSTRLGASPPFNMDTVTLVRPFFVACFTYSIDDYLVVPYILESGSTVEVDGDWCVSRGSMLDPAPFLSQGEQFAHVDTLTVALAERNTPYPAAPGSPVGYVVESDAERPLTMYTRNVNTRSFSSGVYLYATPTFFNVRPRATHPSL